jgi:hypothetical protein
MNLDNFAIEPVNGTWVISRAKVTATAGSGSATYDGQTHSPSACSVTGDYTTGVSCVNNPASVGPDAGTYTIKPVVTGANDNFDLNYVDGSYTINKAPVTATAGSGSATYDGQTHSPSECVLGGDYRGHLSCANDPVSAGPDAGTYTIKPAVTGDDVANFEITAANGSFVISKAPVKATAGSGSAAWDGAMHAPSACVVSGTYTGDLACANKPPSVGPGVGTYVITPDVSGTGLPNFDITKVSGSYSIGAWTLKGFYQPVDMGGVWNTVKAGSTVPLKFNIWAGANEKTDVGAVTSVNASKVTCNTAPEDAIDQLATTGGTVLRYDAAAGQFIDNWKTSGKAGECYKVTMTAQDGSTLTALFKLK